MVNQLCGKAVSCVVVKQLCGAWKLYGMGGLGLVAAIVGGDLGLWGLLGIDHS